MVLEADQSSQCRLARLVATFLAVNWLGLELGILLGVAAAAVHFAFEYARVSIKAFTVVPSRSGAVRPYHYRVVLEAFAGRVVGVALSGMVFFGSATTVAEQVMAVAEALLETQPHTPTATQTFMNLPQPRFSRRRSSDVQRRPSLRSIMSERSLTLRYDGIGALKELDGGLLATATALQAAPLVLLLDLSRVHGIDATAARTFVTLHAKLQRRGVRLAITGLRGNDVVAERIRKLLVGQGLILQKPTLTVAANANASTSDLCSQVVETADGDLEVSTHCASWFPSMDEGLHWCEERFLEVAQQHGLCGPSPQIVTLEEVLRSNLEIPRLILGPTPIDFEEAAEQLQSFCVSQEMRAGDVIFKCGDMADAIYIVERGSVVCYMDFLASNVHSRAALVATPGQLAIENRAQLLKFGPGGIVGDLDFMLQRPRSFTARCPSSSSGGSLWALTRTNFERLAGEAPQVLVLLQTAVLRLNCLSASHALEALERSHL